MMRSGTPAMIRNIVSYASFCDTYITAQIHILATMSLDGYVMRQKRKRAGQGDCEETEPKLNRPASSQSSTVTMAKQYDFSVESADDKNDVKPNKLETVRSVEWKKIKAENLDLDYVRFFSKHEADDILRTLEEKVVYNTGHLAKVLMFGKWIDIPRKQTAYGEEGLTYTFSGNTVPAQPWIPALIRIRDAITKETGFDFNFVLVNRYKDGCDYMGEHKDDEKDLTDGYPIASVSLGQPRDFYFKHQDCRGKNAARKIDQVKLVLEHGSLLLMNAPTNQYWYHALPQRKRLGNVRINLTFRKMNPAMCKPVKKEVGL